MSLMEHMLATNEEVHIEQAMAQERESRERDMQDISLARSEDRKAYAQEAGIVKPEPQRSVPHRYDRGMAGTYTPASRGPAQSAQPQQMPTRGGKPRSEIHGELRLVTTSGQEIGRLEMEAEAK
jgi:hypothetical protein